VGESHFGAFDEYLAEAGRRSHNVRSRARWLFDGVDLRGRRLLDVGAGAGVLSMYAACAGAARVVSLEPEGPGSRSRSPALDAWSALAARVGALERAQFVAATLQDYEPGTAAFDVVLLHASINHLDEDACASLHTNGTAREVYAGLCEKLARLSAPGAALVVSDCSRRNLFGDLGIRNPLAPSIEWHKHQQPELWARLLAGHGFGKPRIRWAAPCSLGRPGRFVLGHRATAYCLRSGFCLTMERLRT
jgi:SAM-dependent methyltransferase